MKGLVTDGKGSLWLAKDIPYPEIGPYDALTENIACGICNGTDFKLIEGNVRGMDTYPAVIGHEAVGRVIERGSKARYLKKGDLVLRSSIPYAMPNYHSLWGGFAEYGVVSDYKAAIEDGAAMQNPAAVTQQVIPQSIDPVTGVMIITLKEVQSAIDRLGFSAGMNVAVAGCGPVGLSMVRLLRLSGADKIIMCGHHEDRIEKAAKLGANILINSKKEDMVSEIKKRIPEGVDMFIDAVGSSSIVNGAMQSIKDDGVIGLYGIGMKAGDGINWERGHYNFKIHSVQWPICEKESAVHDKVMGYILDHGIQLEDFVSDVIGIEDYNKGFEMVSSRKGLKVALKF